MKIYSIELEGEEFYNGEPPYGELISAHETLEEANKAFDEYVKDKMTDKYELVDTHMGLEEYWYNKKVLRYEAYENEIQGIRIRLIEREYEKD